MTTYAQKHDKSVFTTGQVAKICKVAPRTVSKWFDEGRFEGGYLIPGGSDRRIPREGFLKFLDQYGLPKADVTGHVYDVVLVISNDERSVSSMRSRFKREEGWLFQSTNNVFDAGALQREYGAKTVVLDFGIGFEEAQKTVGPLKQNGVSFVVAVVDRADLAILDRSQISMTHVAPFDAESLFSDITKLVRR